MGEYGGEEVVQDSLREEQEENERLCRVIEYAEINMEKAHEDYRSLSDRHLELLGAVREYMRLDDQKNNWADWRHFSEAEKMCIEEEHEKIYENMRELVK